MADTANGISIYGGDLTGELGGVTIYGGGPVSHIGMIIHSTTLDTEEKVIAMYGGKKWERIIGKFLFGADETHDINATGGFFNSALPRHRHDVINNEVATDYHSEKKYDYSFDTDTISYTPGSTSKTVVTGVNMTMEDAGHFHRVPQIPNIPGGGTFVENTIELTGQDGGHVTAEYTFNKGGRYTITNNSPGLVSVNTLFVVDGARIDYVRLEAGQTIVLTSSNIARAVALYFNKAGSVTISNKETVVPDFVYVKATGMDRDEANMPPYKTVYIWERTA